MPNGTYGGVRGRLNPPYSITRKGGDHDGDKGQKAKAHGYKET